MKKYLILGGNGFIGKYITMHLACDNEVVVADYNITFKFDFPNVTYKKIDFVNCDNFTDYLKDIDVVIHLISTIGPNDDLTNVNKEIKDNVFPTINLLNDMVKTKTKQIIFVSSGGTVYGEHSKETICEDEIKRPICNYGIIKDLIEKYIQLYNLYYNLDYRIIRLANPYSEVAKDGRKQGIIPIFMDSLLKKEEINIWGDGNDVRDYIYIDDMIDAILKIIEYDGEEKIFNVGTGIGYSVNDVLGIILKELNITDAKINYHEKRKCDVQNNILNIDRISSVIEWKPKIELENGIKKIIRKKVKGDSKYGEKKC